MVWSGKLQGLTWVFATSLVFSTFSGCGGGDDDGDSSQGTGGAALGGTTARGGKTARGGASFGGSATSGGAAGGAPSSAGTGGTSADQGGRIPAEGGAPTHMGGADTGGAEIGGSGGTLAAGAGGGTDELAGAGGDPFLSGSGGENAGGAGGEQGQVPAFLQPTWLGTCHPLDLSEDGRTALAVEGIWTKDTGWTAIPGLPNATSTRLLALSGDGLVVFGVSVLPSGNQLFRWTRATGSVGLGIGHTLGTGAATNYQGNMLLFWKVEPGGSVSHPFRWTPSNGAESIYNADEDIECGFAWADTLSVSLSSDGARGLFSALGPDKRMAYCEYGFTRPGAIGYAYEDASYDAISGDGTTAVLRRPQVDYSSVAVAAGDASHAQTVCVRMAQNWEGTLVCQDNVVSRLTDIDRQGTRGVGLEIDSNGTSFPTGYFGTVTQSAGTSYYSGRTTPLRQRLPGYCLELEPVQPYISADGTTVLAVAQGETQSGCFLASLDTQAPGRPTVPGVFQGYACGQACSDEVVAVGTRHICAIRTDQTVDCFGAGGSGQLGNGALGDSPVPVRVTGLADAVQLASTSTHTCARLSDGSVWCWGDNSAGQLGDGTLVNRSTPVQVNLPQPAIHIAGGGAHTCAVLQDQTVRCWGQNSDGQLGNGTTQGSSSPVLVQGLTGATRVAAGANASCALVGTMPWCWGAGVATATDTANLELGSVTQISMYGSGTCFLANDGRLLYCSGPGYANSGLAGPYNVWSATVPVERLRAGPKDWCMQLTDGRVRCWQTNERFYGEIAEVHDSTVYESVSDGGYGRCNLLPNGTLDCGSRPWGDPPVCQFDP